MSPVKTNMGSAKTIQKAVKSAAGSTGLEVLAQIQRELDLDLEKLDDGAVSGLGRLMEQRLENSKGGLGEKVRGKLEEIGKPIAANELATNFTDLLTRLLGPAANNLLNSVCSRLGINSAQLSGAPLQRLMNEFKQEIQELRGADGERRYCNELILYCSVDLNQAPAGKSQAIVISAKLPLLLEETLMEVGGPASSKLLATARSRVGVTGERIPPNQVEPVAYHCWKQLGELVDDATASNFAEMFRERTGLDATQPPLTTAPPPPPPLTSQPPPPPTAASQTSAPRSRHKKVVRRRAAATPAPAPVEIQEPADEQPQPELLDQPDDELGSVILITKGSGDLDLFPAGYQLTEFIVSESNMDSYREVLALAQGETLPMPVVITGPAGSGKSHLLLGLARMLEPQLDELEGMLLLRFPDITEADFDLARQQEVTTVLVENVEACPDDLIEDLSMALMDASVRGAPLFITSRLNAEDLNPILQEGLLAGGSELRLHEPDVMLKVELISRVLLEKGVEMDGDSIETLAESITDLGNLPALVAEAFDGGEGVDGSDEQQEEVDVEELDAMLPPQSYSLITRNPFGGVELVESIYRPGVLVISRMSPKQIENLFDFELDLVWLSKMKSPVGIKPDDLDALAARIRTHLAKFARPLVFLEGANYLIMHNSLGEVQKFLSEMIATAEKETATLIIALNPASMKGPELEMITGPLTELEVDGLD